MNTAAISLSPVKIKTILIDLAALLFIYFTPAISHLLSFPLYLYEPMRIMLILSLAHTHRKNAYFIALTLPVFSFIISAHPSILKSLLITGELFLNIWLFIFLSEKIKNVFGAAITSIVLSKIAYYFFKYILISTAFLQTELVSTPIALQGLMAVVFSGYLHLFFSKKE